MGRRKSKSTRQERDTFDIANDSELLRQYLQPIKKLRPIVTHTSPTALPAIEDRRTYHPQGPRRPARSTDKSTHRLVIPTQAKPRPGSKKRTSALPRAVQFEAPNRVLVCIRRKTRKEVLFAKAKTGKGSRAKRHRQSEYSSIRC